MSFADSASSNLIQMADIAIGFLLVHFERRVPLRDGTVAMVRMAEKNGLLLNVQA